jgi:chromosomal replication initiation ATPase DnaA
MQTAAELRAHYDAVRARLLRPLPKPPTAILALKSKRPPIIYPERLRRYPQPIGPVKPIRRAISLRSIVDAVSLQTGIDVRELTGQRRLQPLVDARQVGFYVARKLTGKSFPQIGQAFGGRDPTTVLHGFYKIEQLLPTNTALRSQIEAITELAEARQ